MDCRDTGPVPVRDDTARVDSASRGPGPVDRAQPRARFRSPVEVSAEVLAGRHTALILWNLFWGAKRFYQILRENPGLPRRSLAFALERLENIGLVERRFPPQEPAAVEYALTRAGETLKPLLGSMYLWGLAVCSAQGSVEALPHAPARDPWNEHSRPASDRFEREAARGVAGPPDAAAAALSRLPRTIEME